ncbi:MAG: hypothetical protein Q8P29_00775 [Candidatus Levybacteria bacterium]|nr:hypothetical protein [Candidatus Levybacteria bacterium]
MGSWEEALNNSNRERAIIEVKTEMLEKQKREAMIRLWGHLDNIKVFEKLNDIKNKVWKGGEILKFYNTNVKYRQSVGFSHEDIPLEGAVEVAFELRYPYKISQEVIHRFPPRGLEPGFSRHTGVYIDEETTATITIGATNVTERAGPPSINGDTLYATYNDDARLHRDWGRIGAFHRLSLPTSLEKTDQFILKALDLALAPRFMPPRVK